MRNVFACFYETSKENVKHSAGYFLMLMLTMLLI